MVRTSGAPPHIHYIGDTPCTTTMAWHQSHQENVRLMWIQDCLPSAQDACQTGKAWRRDPGEHPGGIPFALTGETVLPGIAGDSIDSIFEEHTVVASLRGLPPRFPFFARAERVFSFGPVLAAVGGAGDGAPAGAGSGAVAGLKLSNTSKVRPHGCTHMLSGK